MDFQCTKYWRWSCLHWIYWENIKCSVAWPFEWFWAFGVCYNVRKVSKYGGFSGLYFPVFGLNREIYSVFSLNTGKYESGKNSKFGHFLHSFKTYQFYAHSRICWKYNKNERHFSYGPHFSEKIIITKPLDCKFRSDEKEEILTWANTLLKQVKSYVDNKPDRSNQI